LQLTTSKGQQAAVINISDDEDATKANKNSTQEDTKSRNEPPAENLCTTSGNFVE
jgi:hypothetical protein